MEYTKSDRVFTPIRRAIQATIHAIAERLADTYDDDQAGLLLDDLNQELRLHKVLGDTVQLRSEEMAWARYDLNGTLKPVLDPTLLKKTVVNGMLLGVGELTIDDTRTLVYKVQVDIGTEGIESYEVSAPIEASQLAVEIEIPATTRADGELAALFQVLAEIEDPSFRDLVREFMDVLADNERLNAPMLRRIGELAARMLAHPELRDSPMRIDALSKIIKTLLDDNEVYEVKGEEFLLDTSSVKPTIFIKSFEATGAALGAAMVNDYSTDDLSIDTLKETLQPAAIFHDSANVPHYVPLKHITEYNPLRGDDVSADLGSCQSSIGRFVAQNPMIFSKGGSV